MKFKIFWIDDSKTWVRSVESDIAEAFSDKGFEPEIQKFQTIVPARESILSSYADLVLVDCNLPDEQRGDELIKQLRESRCFAHIVFYSQSQENLSSLAEDKHYLHVVQRDDITDLIEKVADQAFRKYKHPAFMRGLLLSEFIDLENAMEDFISSMFKSESDYFRKSIIHQGGEGFSLSSKQKFIFRVIKDASSKNNDLKTSIENVGLTSSQFDKNIIKKRNILAHAHPEYDSDSGEIKLVSPIQSVEFSSQWFHDTRESIHLTKEKLKSIAAMNLHQTVNP